MYVPSRKRERMLRSSVTWRQDSELKFDQTYTNKLVSDSLKNSRMRHYSYSTKDLSLQNTHVSGNFSWKCDLCEPFLKGQYWRTYFYLILFPWFCHYHEPLKNIALAIGFISQVLAQRWSWTWVSDQENLEIFVRILWLFKSDIYGNTKLSVSVLAKRQMVRWQVF